MKDDPQLANCKKRNEGVRKHIQVNTINYKKSVKTVLQRIDGSPMCKHTFKKV